jgi:hypothetical protein
MISIPDLYSFLFNSPFVSLTLYWKGECMKIGEISFGITEWSEVERTEHKGINGAAYWKTKNFGDIRVRMVEYSAGYLADHWCKKGHILGSSGLSVLFK